MSRSFLRTCIDSGAITVGVIRLCDIRSVITKSCDFMHSFKKKTAPYLNLDNFPFKVVSLCTSGLLPALLQFYFTLFFDYLHFCFTSLTKTSVLMVVSGVRARCLGMRLFFFFPTLLYFVPWFSFLGIRLSLWTEALLCAGTQQILAKPTQPILTILQVFPENENFTLKI